MNIAEQQCSICGSSISLLHIQEKLLCENCLHIGIEQLTLPWKNALATLLKDYGEACLRCISSDDPEDVHLARVTGRKIRAILEFLGVDKKHELLIAIKEMHHVYNKIRETDVLINEMKNNSDNNKVYSEMVALVTRKRKKLRNSLIKEVPTIIDDSYFNNVDYFLNEELSSYVVALEKEKAIHESETKFFHLVEIYHQSVSKNGKFASESIKALHSIRIQSKSLRYLFYFLTTILDEEYQDKVDFYKNIQNQFGDINDVQDWLYQIKAYENKLNTTKNEIDLVKKNIKARLHHLIEKVDLTGIEN